MLSIILVYNNLLKKIAWLLDMQCSHGCRDAWEDVLSCPLFVVHLAYQWSFLFVCFVGLYAGHPYIHFDFITRCAYAQGRVKHLSPSIYLCVCRQKTRLFAVLPFENRHEIATASQTQLSACSKNYKAKGSICVKGLLYRHDHVDVKL